MDLASFNLQLRWLCWHFFQYSILQISQYVFEETFNLRFAIPFDQHNVTVSSSTLNHLTPKQRSKVKKLNALDTELYEFAKKLLFQRFEKLKAKDAHFNERFSHLGLLTGKNGVTEFNWDRNLDETFWLLRSWNHNKYNTSTNEWTENILWESFFSDVSKDCDKKNFLLNVNGLINEKRLWR